MLKKSNLIYDSDAKYISSNLFKSLLWRLQHFIVNICIKCWCLTWHS